jgi:hypothetical protein
LNLGNRSSRMMPKPFCARSSIITKPQSLALKSCTGILMEFGMGSLGTDNTRHSSPCKIVKQPGPYQSVLNAYLAEIAQLRETRPQPLTGPLRRFSKRSTGWRLAPTASGHLCALARLAAVGN